MLGTAVFTVNRYRPLWVISIQHGAVWRSGNGDPPMGAKAASADTWNTDTVPLLAPPWALDTNSWAGLVGRNSLPNGPGPWAARGESGAATSSPSGSTVKLSIRDVPARAPARWVPVLLNRTSSGWEPLGSVTVEPARA